MDPTINLNSKTIKQSIEVYPNEPLWKRVPTQDEDGKLLSDFMMLLPGLNTLDKNSFLETITLLNNLFAQYNQYVVFQINRTTMPPATRVMPISSRGEDFSRK